MTFSGTTMLLLGISQATFVFALATVLLFMFNRKLKRRSKELTERLDAQSKLHKQTVNTLKSKLESQKHQAPPIPVETVEVPGGEYSGILNKNVQQTEDRLRELGAEPNADFQIDDSAEIIAARMRHAFLESEKLVLAFATDPELMWETLQPNIDKITIGLRRHNAALMSDGDIGGHETDGQAAELKEKLETLESRWLNLESQAQTSLDALEANYTTLTQALASQEAGTNIHEQTDALANHFLEMLNHITAADYPQKDYQVQLAGSAGEGLVEDVASVDVSAEDDTPELDPFADMPSMESPLPDEEENPIPATSAAPDDAQIDAEIDALADSLAETPGDADAQADMSEPDLEDLLLDDTDANDDLTMADLTAEDNHEPNSDQTDDIASEIDSALDSTLEDDMDELDLTEDLSETDPDAIFEAAAAAVSNDSNKAQQETEPQAPSSKPDEPTDDDQNLTDDIDAILAETNALLEDDEEEPSEEISGDELEDLMAAVDEDDDDEDDPYSANNSQLDALDEEFLALAGEPLSDPKDINPSLLIEDDDDDMDFATPAPSTAPEPPVISSTPDVSSEDTPEDIPVDDALPAEDEPVEDDFDEELDPDAIIAAALAETEATAANTEDGAQDIMDEATFEDLLADSGVDLHGDLSQK